MQKLKTIWSNNVSDKPLQEYPRPQFERASYLNLNGVWQYAITDIDEKGFEWQGDILVPFSPESFLSRVEKTLTPDKALWYRRTFLLEENFNVGRVFLNFGAVDYYCKVFINGKVVGENYGGYYPFSFEITNEITVGVNEILVYVLDPSNTSYHDVGKQQLKRGGIWYSVTSGIWQTVFIESTPKDYIKSIKITPHLFEKRCNFIIDKVGEIKETNVKVYFKGEKVFEDTFDQEVFDVVLDNVFEWSPETPNLYDVEIIYGEDRIKTYFAMREVEIRTANDNVKRIFLNGKPYYMNGLLDQGYYSDGIYTAPTDEALKFDIEKCKELGFNTLRKHIKIEPLRWYYYCDKIGMLVWQDMISGGTKYNMALSAMKQLFNIKVNDQNYKLLGREDKEGRVEYYVGLNRMVELLYNSPSIVLWTPFNEGWGQFDALSAYNMVKELDDTRLIDHASGWYDQGGLDFHSEHIYFKPVVVKLDKGANKRPYILTEFGGYSLKLKDHSFNLDKTFGYKLFENREKFNAAYKKMFERDIVNNIDKGLCASIYTQVSDVEDETNGLFTYDRKVLKVDSDVCLEIKKQIDEKYKDL